MTSERIHASVGILTFNSGKVLRAALESVKDFDDIVICDGGSTDDTAEIARAFGARIIMQDSKFKNPNGTLKDFGGVRQQTLEAAKHDWFLYIDSDETISEGLREEIREITSQSEVAPPAPLVYKVPYGICMDGRPIRYSSNFPGYQYRFFNRTSGAHFIKQVHERISFDTTKVPVGVLKNPWYTYARRADSWNYLRDTRAYRRLEARMFRNRPFGDFLKFVVWSGLRTFVGASLKATRNYLLHGFKDSAPLGDEFGRAVSPLLLIGDVLKEYLFAHKEFAWRVFPSFFLSRTFRYINAPTKEDIAKRRAEAELFCLPELLARAPNAAFLDVGANVGAYTYVASKHISKKQIYAFEPQMMYVKRLRALFPGVIVEALALSSAEGTAQFKIPEINGTPYPTRGTLEHFKEDGEKGATYETVKLSTLDAYCEQHAITAISVLKIDVEGHELAVLEGAQSTLGHLHPRIIIEIEQRHHEQPIGDIFAFIEKFGYSGWFFDTTSLDFKPLSAFSVATHQQSQNFKTELQVNNFLFLPAGENPPQASIPGVGRGTS